MHRRHDGIRAWGTAFARALVLAAVVTACAKSGDPEPPADGASAAAAPVDAGPIVDAEHAFADTVAERGWNAGVRAYAAPDGIVLSPGPVNALESLDPDEPPGGSPLQWWPAWAGIARSGDLGFTTGPYFLRGRGYVGHYFTVWRREPGGTWKWIFDGGVDVLDDAPPARDSAVDRLPVAEAGSPGNAQAEVEALDAAVAVEAVTDAPAAIERRLSADARVNRAFLPRAVGLDASRATLEGHAEAVRFEPLGGAASGAGDLVFTYGRARWTAEDGPGIGYYARIWQVRPEGWKLVFDEIVPHRAPPPEN